MKIAILTNFMSFLPGYSLTGIVIDQTKMLTRYNHEVHLFVNERYDGESFPADVILEKKIPFSHLTDYTSMNDLSAEHKMCRNKTSVMLQAELKDYDIVFTHDFVFTGWFLPYGLGSIEASKQLDKVKWLHWIHSVPTRASDWWNMRMMGPKHKIIYPNETDRLRVAEQYRGSIKDVRMIPHIKDLRSFCDFDAETCDFIDAYPAVMQADVVQIYPASVDRLTAKRVREVIIIFSKIKKMGFSVCLALLNQWATGRQQREDIDKYKKQATRAGLEVGKEVIFTSDFKEGRYGVGIPKRMVRELFMCSNLFIFPTREESFGLVLPEALLAGGCLPVLNKSLSMQTEISGHNAIYFDFGSYHSSVSHDNEDRFLQDVSIIIIGRMRQNESLLCKTFMRQRYNYDSLYNKFYAPIMAESKLWI